MMQQREGFGVALPIVLVLGAAFLQWHCFRGGASCDAIVMGVVAQVLLFLLGRPWKVNPFATPVHWLPVLLAALFVIVGFVTDLTFTLVLGWTILLYCWIETIVQPSEVSRIGPLMVLALFAFPWIDSDLKLFTAIFRDSSAAAISTLMGALGWPTIREGQTLLISGRLIEIGDACSGHETLYAMVVVGVATAYCYFASSIGITASLPVIVLYAWIANTLRILMICMATMRDWTERYTNYVHDYAGWFVIAATTVLCVLTLKYGSRVILARQVATKESRLALGRRKIATQVKSSRHSYSLILLVSFCCVLGFVFDAVPLSDAKERIEKLEKLCEKIPYRVMAITDAERTRLGAATVIKRRYRIADRDFIVTLIDGTNNRRAVHDPMYCWTTASSTEQPVFSGFGNAVRVREDGKDRQLLFWFSDGSSRHASPVRYWIQTSLRRATLGAISKEPVFVMIEPVESGPVNWFKVLDRCPWLNEV